MQVSILGVGLLGSAIAERLVEHGWKLRVYDSSPAVRDRTAHIPMEWACSEQQAVEGATRAVLCLPNSGVTATLLPALFPAMAKGGLVVDCTTGDPSEMESFGAAARATGRAYLDATIGGSSAQTRKGNALVMVGGLAADVEAAMPLLQSISRQVVPVGGAGCGARMKLVMNLALGLHRAVLAEALHFGTALGFEAPLTLSILRDGPAYSRVMDTKADRMLNGDFRPDARLSQHRKDVGLMLSQAAALGIQLPLSAAHDRLLEMAEQQGFGEFDNSAVIKAYDKLC